MDGKILARIGAVIFIAVAFVATAIGMNSKDKQPDAPATRSRPAAPQDPLAAELLRCSRIGEAGPRDPSCLKAWAESRRRFLGRRVPATPPAAAVPTTLFPNVPASEDPNRKAGGPADLIAPAGQAEPSWPEVR